MGNISDVKDPETSNLLYLQHLIDLYPQQVHSEKAHFKKITNFIAGLKMKSRTSSHGFRTRYPVLRDDASSGSPYLILPASGALVQWLSGRTS